MQGGARHCRLVGKEEWTTVDWSQLQGGESIWRNNSLPGRKSWRNELVHCGQIIQELITPRWIFFWNTGITWAKTVQKCVFRLNWRGLWKRKSPLLSDSFPTWKARGLRPSCSERSSYNFLRISIINIINKLFREVVSKFFHDHHH